MYTNFFLNLYLLVFFRYMYTFIYVCVEKTKLNINFLVIYLFENLFFMYKSGYEQVLK